MRGKDFGALLLLAALWGGSFLFIRVAVPVLGPIVLAELRFAIAGMGLLLFAGARGALPGLRRAWWKYLVLGALNGAIPSVLIATAELHLTASLAAILNATVPLCTALAGAIWLKEPLRIRTAAGIALGIAGVAVLVGWSALPRTPAVVLSICASMGAASSFGLVNVFAKVAFVRAAPLTLAIGQQLGASALLLPLAVPAAATRGPTIRVTPLLACAVLALALLCTSLGYLLFFYLIVRAGPLGAASVTLLTPVTGIAWGALFLREPVRPGAIAGCAVILASVVLVTGTRIRIAHRTPAVAETALCEG